MHKIILLSSLLLLFKVQALDYGAMCDPTPLYRESWQYDDSCEDVYLYCDPSTNTCNYKGCSNADYIAGWDTKVRPLPVRCNSSTYCPDNNSKCTPTVPTGQRCEIQRDDECSGNNAICLNSTCFIKGAPLGGNCGSDLTVYITYDAAGDSLQQTIIRDNCTDGTYCFSAVCIESKVNDSPCEQDRECLSGTCSNGGICINGPEVFHKIQPWLWGVLGAAVVIFVLLVLGLLWILHRYQSKQEHQKITKFFGDNEEFAKYAMMNDDDDSYYDNDSRTNLPLNDSRNLVYLTTPDYRLSQALTVGSKSASTSALNLSSSNSTPRLSSTTNIASRTRATPSNEI